MKKILFFLLIASFISGWAGMPLYAQDTKEDAESYYKLGKVYYEQGRYKEAEELFQKSLDILAREQEKYPVRPDGTGQEKPAEPQAAPAPLAANTRQEYLIGVDDSLHVGVWQNPDLDQEVIVRPDGKMSFPLVGDIQAEGLTLPQLTAAMTAKLAEFVKNPQVSLAIKKIGGKRVVILGQVANPGVITVGGSMSIMEAIGQAGGFTRDAVPSSTVVIRGGLGAAQAQKLNLSKVFKGDLRDNITVQSQDIIFVPRKFISDLNYFLNQVLEPLSRGAYLNNELQTW